MRIVHIIGGSEKRGASIGALTLHNALVSKGIDSSVVIQKSSPMPGVVSLSSSMFGMVQQMFFRRLDRLPLALYGRRKRQHLFSVGWTGNRLHNRRIVREADVVHLHWINGGMLSISSLSKFRKPVVWTIRDMWSFTGGCHYSLNCRRYEQGCGACPILSSHRSSDVSRSMSRRKRTAIGDNVHPVAISEWLRCAAESSTVFSGRSLRVIHNGVDMRDYFPVDKAQAKRQLNIDENQTVLSFGSQYVKDPYKGFSIFLSSLDRLDLKDYTVLIFGNACPHHVPLASEKVRKLGFLESPEEKRLAYSASDVMVTPSLQEAFGKVLVESMACRTPVVAFRTGGPLDIVSHKHSGYLADPYDPEDLARGIVWVTDNSRHLTLCDKALDAVRRKFDITNIAETYLSLYRELVVEHGASSNRPTPEPNAQ